MPPKERQAVFASESLEGKAVEPENANLLASSRDIGWASLLVDEFKVSGESDEYERRLTPDLRLVIALGGTWDISAKYGSRWSKAILQAGSVAVNDGNQSMRLRWRNRHHSRPFHLAAIYLPPSFLHHAVDEMRRPGQRLHSEVGSSLVLNDRAIGGTLAALVRANRNAGSDLYAEQAARWLATHLVHAHGKAYNPSEDDRQAGSIADRRLTSVIAFMRENLGEPITIAEMARVAAVSPFHFSRLFHRQVGQTPQRYMAEQRMLAAEGMLRSTELSVFEIAEACGFAHQSAFSTAFLRRFSVSPTTYRSRERN
jgi:AraC family transcriptional regulator